MEKLASIIVPVYKAEAFLPECIESILQQSYQNWELLLVEDGSPDNSGALCNAYAAQDKRIRVFHKENGGQSSARNLGMEQANGDYLMFVDADDRLADADVLEAMIRKLETSGADVAVADHARFWKGRILPASSAALLEAWDRNSRAFRFQGFYSQGELSYVWGKLYRRAFLEEHSIRFPALGYAEDKVFSIHCYFCGAQYIFTGQIGYHYRMNPTSISYRYRPNSCQQWLRAARQMQADHQLAGAAAEQQDIIWYAIVFAAFFDAKMEYVEKQHRLNAVRALLRTYGADLLAKQAFREVGKPAGARDVGQMLWSWMLWGFSVAMRLHWYAALSLGIKLLVELRIDERLSDTGLRE